MFEEDSKHLTFIDAVKASDPPNGIIKHYKDYWWAVHPTKGLIVNRKSPQCNPKKEVVVHIVGKLYPWASVQFVPSVFVPVNIEDYC